MGPREVVDLLSSDNEIHPSSSRSAKANTNLNTPANDGFIFLSDDPEGAYDPGYNWAAVPSKRRKLSASSFREVDAVVLPSLPSISSKYSSHTLAARGRPTEDDAYLPLHESDPIVFISSLKKTSSHAKGTLARELAPYSDLSDDSFPEDLLSAPPQKKAPGLSVRTAAFLDSLSQPLLNGKTTSSRSQSVTTVGKSRKIESREPRDDGGSSGTEANTTKTVRTYKASKHSKLTEEEKVERARQKEHDKALKAREREVARAEAKELKAKEREGDRERKRLLKEEKAREKRIAADLAEVNKSKIDKKDSTPEMIVDLPASIDGQSIDTQVRELLKNLDVDAALYQSPIPNIIRWRRKSKARWNPDLDHWEPIERMEIHDEKHVMCLMSAKEFLTLAMVQNDREDLETHVVKLKNSYDDCIPIYLIEGLHSWMRKNKAAENSAYQAKVNSLTQSDETSSSNKPISRRKKPTAEAVDEDLIEDALLQLQVAHNCLVHHTSSSAETAEWIANFTQHISTIPYKYVPTSM